MSYCPKCGKEVVEGSLFCQHCGGNLSIKIGMTNEHLHIERNRRASGSLVAGIFTLSYCLVLTMVFWGRLSVLATDILIWVLPIFLIGSLAIFLGFISIQRISLSQGMLKGKTASIAGIVLGFLSFVILLLPRVLSGPLNYEVVLQLQEAPTQKITPSILKETKHVLSSRIRDFAAHRIKTVPPDKIVVHLRVLDTFKEDGMKPILRYGAVSLHLVYQDNDNIVNQRSSPDVTVPEGYKPVTIDNKTLLVRIAPELVDNVKDAKVQFDSYSSRPAVAVQFTSEGGKRLFSITKENINRRLAIMVDEKVYSAPVIRAPIAGGQALITGGFTMEEAYDIARILRSGAIPLPINIIESHFIER